MATNKAVVLTERCINDLAKAPGLNAAAALLLWNLVKSLGPTGQQMSLTAMATDLGLTRITVTNAMQDLLKAGFIQRGPKAGRLYLYKLNPAFFYHL